MGNDVLEKALEETWRNKEKFYEDYKGMTMLEIVQHIEEKYAKEPLVKSGHPFNAHIIR